MSGDSGRITHKPEVGLLRATLTYTRYGSLCGYGENSGIANRGTQPGRRRWRRPSVKGVGADGHPDAGGDGFEATPNPGVRLSRRAPTSYRRAVAPRGIATDISRHRALSTDAPPSGPRSAQGKRYAVRRDSPPCSCSCRSPCHRTYIRIVRVPV